MCANYGNKTNLMEIYDLFSSQRTTVNHITSKVATQDIRPTNSIVTVRQKDDIHLISTYWGIKFSDSSPLIFNSRIETIAGKPFWKNALKNNRALLPMTEFYEWKEINKKKVRHKIFMPNESLFFVPALLHEKDGKIFSSLVTVPPNKFMESIHHRMPAIVRKEYALALLDAEIDLAIEMCQPFDGDLDIIEDF